MAEEQQDESQKTEDPTSRRLEQAREKGQVARSQEVGHWFMLLAFTVIVALLGQSLIGGLALKLRTFIARPHTLPIDGGALQTLMFETLTDLGVVLLPALALLFLAGIVSGLIQNGLVISVESLKPKLEKLSLVKGLKRLFSTRSLVEFLKGIAKITIVATVAVLLVRPELAVIPEIASLGTGEFVTLLQSLAVRVLLGVLAVMTIIAALDFLYQRQQHHKQLRMSKQEVKEEFKQTEGDPMVKARLRQIRMERARRRMMAAVPEADVVITNPSHFAVALRYDPERMQAPVLTAKGVESLALKIREIARESGVPVVENPPLARALYAGVELDQEVPPVHYKAVAEVIGYVMRLKGKLARDARPRD